MSSSPVRKGGAGAHAAITEGGGHDRLFRIGLVPFHDEAAAHGV